MQEQRKAQKARNKQKTGKSCKKHGSLRLNEYGLSGK